jgi:hypothetical protein
MKGWLLFILVAVFLITGCSGVVPGPPIEPPEEPPSDFLEFIGIWVNTDPNADNVTKIQILEVDDDNLSVEQWGKAHPDDSYLGLILLDKKEITNRHFKLTVKVFLGSMEEEFYLEEDKLLRVETLMTYDVPWAEDFKQTDYFKQK